VWQKRFVGNLSPLRFAHRLSPITLFGVKKKKTKLRKCVELKISIRVDCDRSSNSQHYLIQPTLFLPSPQPVSSEARQIFVRQYRFSLRVVIINPQSTIHSDYNESINIFISITASGSKEGGQL